MGRVHEYLGRAGLRVSAPLAEFIEAQALPGTGIGAEEFWRRLADLLGRFAPANVALLQRRDALQAAIDAWHQARPGNAGEQAEYLRFLREIGYLVDEPEPFEIETSRLDPEVATLAGPQLVVPVLNARFLLNATNARWGSLYDAFYGTDAIPGAPRPGSYDAPRGAEVVRRVKAFLDEAVPLAGMRWAGWAGGALPLADPGQLAARCGESLLLRNNGLHIEVLVDRDHPVGREDPAGIADVIVEAALTTIVDLEDSVATADAEDKVQAYANWLGLMRGNLTATFEKDGKTLQRALAPDRDWTALDGTPLTLPGRSLLLVRNVGHLMTTPAVLLPDGSEAPEGLLDGVITSLIAMHDLNGCARFRNSATGSVYIVKPKMHGAEECAFANALFDAIEDLLGLDRYTIKIGVMDEERRTSANLSACIHAVRGRIAFINTGFLDRTGDEIHTSMHAGAVLPKAKMRAAAWIRAYEDRNVRIGVVCGFAGRAQIGKGMWAAPDRMAAMLEEKVTHPRSGASTAWVPSPTAAALHAMHYHLVDVASRQRAIAAEGVPAVSELLTIPLLQESLSAEEIREELANCAQGILGYVVRWVDQGIGCSKVPDIHDIGLMEDRATLRISSQLIANWLLHGICTADDVDQALVRMAAKVDAQNAKDPLYRRMTEDDGSLAMAAARALIFEGTVQPNGYTEPLLHRFRLHKKARDIPT